MDTSALIAKLRDLPPSDIGDRIRVMREICGMTQEELAGKLQTSRQSIYKYEKGLSPRVLCSYPKLVEISRALSTSGLQVTVEDFIL